MINRQWMFKATMFAGLTLMSVTPVASATMARWSGAQAGFRTEVAQGEDRGGKCEKQQGDDKCKRNPGGTSVAKGEKDKGDDKGKHGREDKSIAKGEKQPGDDRGGKGHDDRSFA